MAIRPLYDRVLIRRAQAESTSSGGIVLPGNKEKPEIGEVIAIGTGRFRENGEINPLIVKPGDKVIFGKYSGTEIKIDGEELLMMREEDIMGIQE